MARKKNAVRKDGLIAVQVYIGIGDDGRRKYKTVYGHTQKEADEKADEIKISLGKGIDISRANDTFSDWSNAWLKSKDGNVSTSYYTGMSGKVRYINDRIGALEISKIRTVQLQNIIDDLSKQNVRTKKPTSKKTLKDYKGIMEQTFEMAIENRIMDYNPAKYVRIPQKAPQDHRRALTDEEQSWIINTPHRAQRIAILCMYSGLRRGEAIPLRWGDIDFKSGTISVTKFVEMVNGQPCQKPYGKTACSRRTIDIPSQLVSFLESEYSASNSTPMELVCPDTSGKMMSEESFRKMWNSYITDLNFKYGNRIDAKGNVANSKYNCNGIPITIPRITLHWMRHTFATLLYLSGVDVLTAKDQLGHSDIKTTLEIYTHLDQIYKRKSMSKLDDYLQNKNSMQVKCK